MRSTSEATVVRDAPSQTALRVAALRALHQILDVPPVFVDPLAVPILGPDATALLDQYRATAGQTAPLRATLAARSVFAAEVVDEAVERGVRQCVILGAGLDTFAYRHRYADLRVFEVDHPRTQAWKRDVLRCAGIGLPPTLAFVEADLERDDVLVALRGAGFDPWQPAVFVMLGVSFYVDRLKLLSLFARIGNQCAAGSEIVFDVSEPLDRAPDGARERYEAAAARVAASGEPWITFFSLDDIEGALRRSGFAVLMLDASAQDARWFDGRTDGLSVVPLAHLVRARTGASAIGTAK